MTPSEGEPSQPAPVPRTSISQAKVSVDGTPAASFSERQELPATETVPRYTLHYLSGYPGPPISLTLPVRLEPYTFNTFPPYFDGLLPEGVQLEGLLRQEKIDRNDNFAQLLAVGADLVGAVTVEPDPTKSEGIEVGTVETGDP